MSARAQRALVRAFKHRSKNRKHRCICSRPQDCPLERRSQQHRNSGRILNFHIAGSHTCQSPEHHLPHQTRFCHRSRSGRTRRHSCTSSPCPLVHSSLLTGHVPSGPTFQRMWGPHRDAEVELLKVVRRRSYDVKDGVVIRRRMMWDNPFNIHFSVRFPQLRFKGTHKCTVRPLPCRSESTLLGWVSEPLIRRSHLSPVLRFVGAHRLDTSITAASSRILIANSYWSFRHHPPHLVGAATRSAPAPLPFANNITRRCRSEL